jgi:hypothetical protein
MMGGNGLGRMANGMGECARGHYPIQQQCGHWMIGKGGGIGTVLEGGNSSGRSAKLRRHFHLLIVWLI